MRGSSVLVGPVLLSAIFSGPLACRAHVHVPTAPDQEAPSEVRRHFYETYQPRRPTRDDIALRARLFHARPSVAVTQLVLGEALVVESVEDLRPLIAPDGDVSRAIDTALAARTRADIISGLGIGALSLGIGTAGFLVATQVGIVPGQGSSASTTEISPYVLGALGSAVAGLALGGTGIAWGMVERQEEEDATTRAYRGLDAALRSRLGLDEASRTTEP